LTVTAHKDIVPREAAKARFARLAGLAATLPLVAGAVWLFAMPQDHAWRGDVLRVLVLYGALSLAFLGGIRWGASMANRAVVGRADMLIALLSIVVGGAGALLPAPMSFAVLAAGFAAQGAWDVLSAFGGGVAEWYGPVRTRLTAIAVVALVLAFIATS